MRNDMSKKNKIGEAVKRHRAWRMWFAVAATHIILFVALTGCLDAPPSKRIGHSQRGLVATPNDGGIVDGSIGSWGYHPVKVEEFYQGENCFDEAVDRAFQAAGGAGGRDGFKILFGPSTYCFDKPIFVQDGFTFQGSGRASTRLQFAVDQSGIIIAGQGDIASYGADAGLSGYSGSVIKQVVIRDMTITGNGGAIPTSGTTDADGVVYNGSGLLQNVVVEKFERDGIHVGGAAFGSDDEFNFYSSNFDVLVQNNGRAGFWIEDTNMVGMMVSHNLQASSNGDSVSWPAGDRYGIVNENDSGDFTWINSGSESNYNSQNWRGCQSCRDVLINPYSEGGVGQAYGNQAVIVGGAAAAVSPGIGATNRPTHIRRGEWKHSGLKVTTQYNPGGSSNTQVTEICPVENDVFWKSHTSADSDRDLNFGWDATRQTFRMWYEGDDSKTAFEILSKSNSTSVDDGMLIFKDGFLLGDTIGTNSMRVYECGSAAAKPASGDCAIHQRGDSCYVQLPDKAASCSVCGSYSSCTQWTCAKNGAAYEWHCSAGF